MNPFEDLTEAIIKGDLQTGVAETKRVLDGGWDVKMILEEGLFASMDEVGERYSRGLMFVPEMLQSARVMQECLEVLRPLFQKGGLSPKGKVIIGTVKHDIHNIGKNLVIMMMEGGGYAVTDLGVDVSPKKFVQKAQELEVDIVAMSALLSTSMVAMKETIEALKEAGIRDKVKVMIGGAPVTEQYAHQIGADSYAPDAGSAVIEAKRLLSV
jgi:5-methyltetrahydrofolate--homocysteine methyltransferase